MSTALLIIRLAVGAVLLLQGYAKLTEQGRCSTADWLGSIGFRPAGPLAVLTGLVEVVTGALFVAGLATPAAAAGAVGLLTVAAVVNGANGYWNANGGAEYPLLLGAVVAALAFSGAGEISLDAALGWADPTGTTGVVAVAIGLLAAAPPALQHRRARQVAPVTALPSSDAQPKAA